MHLCLSITFLDRRFHGRRDGGAPEWPPSPLRLFQAIVAPAAAGSGPLGGVAEALRWLEGLRPPMIVAPRGVVGAAYRLSVPNNAMDLVAKAWSKGNYDGAGDANPATHRTMKTVRPMHLLDGDQVHYIWPLPNTADRDDIRYAEAIAAAVRSVVVLGWGTDLVVGHGRVIEDAEATSVAGERWLPATRSRSGTLRVPIRGTLDALFQRHAAFTHRLTDAGLVPVPPLTAFATVAYRRGAEPPPRPLAAFSLLRLDGERFRAFSTPNRALAVAGMARHALAAVAREAKWSDEQINAVVLGHTPDGGAPARSEPGKPRLAYVPLPSIERRGVGRAEYIGSIRRVLILGNWAPEAEELVAWARRALAGRDLTDESSGEPCAMLAPIASSDWMVRRYTKGSTRWATVTPIVLDRHPKQRSRPAAMEEMAKIVAQACTRAGLPRPSGVTVSAVSPLPGAPHTQAFAPLRRKDGSAPNTTHALISFTEPVPGPVLIGAGRFRGYGLCTPNGEPEEFATT